MSKTSEDNYTEQGLNEKTVEKLQSLITQGKFSATDIDPRVCERLRSLSDDSNSVEALFEQIDRSDLTGVHDKAAFLSNLIKQWTLNNESSATARKPGPDEMKLKEILERTGYKIEVTAGQRKYGGPPPDGPERPDHHSEVFIGKLPREVFEDELIPLCENIGKIWDLRLMIDPVSGYNKGYCFVTYCSQTDSIKACEQLNGLAIRPGKYIKANSSVANLRLFIGNIPKTKSKDEIRDELVKSIEGVVDVIVYAPADEVEKKKNRGFCFVDFDHHKNASAAKRKLSNGRLRLFNRDIAVDWADPDEEPDDEIMSQVKVLYVRNLTSEVTENDVKNVFLPHGNIERVRKVRDYAFVHFEKREDALKAMNVLNGTILGRNSMEINLAKPMSEKRKQAQIKREQRKQFDPSFHQRGHLSQKLRTESSRNGTRTISHNATQRNNRTVKTNPSASNDRTRPSNNAGFYLNESSANNVNNGYNHIYPMNTSFHPPGSFHAPIQDPNSLMRASHPTMSFPTQAFPMNPIQQNQPYGGYIVFHHSPYAIGPVLACYTTTTTPPYLPASISENPKRIHDDIDEKNRRSMVICKNSNTDPLCSEQ